MNRGEQAPSGGLEMAGERELEHNQMAGPDAGPPAYFQDDEPPAPWETPASQRPPSRPMSRPLSQPPRRRRRQLTWRVPVVAGLCLLLVLVIAGTLVLLVGKPGQEVNWLATPTGHGKATATSTTSNGPAAAPTTETAPSAPLTAIPTAVVNFSVLQPTTFTQTCSGTEALSPLTLALDNGGSNMVANWWLEVDQHIPGTSAPWAYGAPPYGTIPRGQSTTMALTPDATLCGQMLAHGVTAPVVYKAYVHYAGMGQVTLTDTVTPPPPGTATATPGS